jgi:radical SAM superfamily enzyme YgiQ (UPF0313 family)
VGYLESFQDVPLYPLALLSVASYIADDCDVRIIDQRIDREWERSLQSALDTDVLCVGVTAMTGPQISFGLQASNVARAHTDAPIVWGGVHATVLPEQTVSHPLVDIVVEGEGEIAFRDLVQALYDGSSYDTIPGIWTMRDGGPAGSPSGVITDLAELPPLPWRLLDMKRYIGRDEDGRRRLAMKTSRGCPYRCYFCHQTGKKRRKWRALPAGMVLEHMEWLQAKFGIRSFHILDDNFFVDRHRTTAFLEALAKRGWDISYVINGTRVTDILRMNDETLELLARTGCAELQIGLESGSQAMLDHMKKDTTLEQVREANRRLRAHGLTRYYELVSGHSGESEEDIRQTASLILELSEGDPGVFFAPLESLTPYPGTEAFLEAEREGMVFPGDLEGWAAFGWDRALLPWVDDARRRLLERFHIFPTLISSRIKTERGRLLQILHEFYRPLARLRVRHLYFGLPLELALFRMLAKIRQRSH